MLLNVNILYTTYEPGKHPSVGVTLTEVAYPVNAA